MFFKSINIQKGPINIVFDLGISFLFIFLHLWSFSLLISLLRQLRILLSFYYEIDFKEVKPFLGMNAKITVGLGSGDVIVARAEMLR